MATIAAKTLKETSGIVRLWYDGSYTQNVSANTSSVTINLKVTSLISNIGPWDDFGGSHLNNVSFTKGIGSMAKGTTVTLKSVTFTVKHNADGTGSVSCPWKWGVNSSWGGMVKPSGTITFSLAKIARNSTTSTAPSFTAPNSVTCSINRSSTFTHTVVLQLKNSSGSWVDCGTLTEQATNATFSSEAVMKNCYSVLAQRSSCSARFAIYTNGPNGWTYGPEGTCYSAGSNTINAPTFTATNSVTFSISKASSAFTSTVTTSLNGYSFGSISGTSASSVTLNNTVDLRTNCIRGLAQGSSGNYIAYISTYYSGVLVGSWSINGTVNAPAVDRITAPTFTAGNTLTTTITTDSSELSRYLTLVVNGTTIASQGTSTSKTFTWNYNDKIFGALGTNTSVTSYITVTTYYNGIQVRSSATTYGTVSAPAVCTCTAPNWTAGNTFVCSITKPSSLLTCSIVLQVKNNSGNFVDFQSVTKTSASSVNFADTVALNTTLFNYLAQTSSRETKIIITTYYNNNQVRSPITLSGTLSAPAATTPTTSTSWIAGDTMTLNLPRVLSSLTHKVEINIGDTNFLTKENITTSITFGNSDADRENIYTLLAGENKKTAVVKVTTYYNGVQVRTPTSTNLVCNAPPIATATLPTRITAGNGFQVTVTNSKNYLYYSIGMTVGNQFVQKYEYTTESKLGFASTPEINILVYTGLNKQAQANAVFTIKMYYKKSDGTYIQVNTERTYSISCYPQKLNSILEMTNTWTAGSSFNATISRQILNFYSKIDLLVNGQVVQTYSPHTNVNLNYSLIFANTKEINVGAITALAQKDKGNAQLLLTTYYGTNLDNLVEVGSTTKNFDCMAPAKSTVQELTSTTNPVIIDNTELTCKVTKPLEEYDLSMEVYFNNKLITTVYPTEDNPTDIVFDTTDYIEELYKAIPTQQYGTLELRVITKYGGAQVRDPYKYPIEMKAVADTVKVKIDDNADLETLSKIIDRATNTFIDNTSMIGSKVSALDILIDEGYFYLETKYGGYITQIKAQIANSVSMLQVYNYTEEDIKYNLEHTRIINEAFTENPIVMGPYDFPSVTQAGTKNILEITATDSRGFTVVKQIDLLIFPYSSPTIRIDDKKTTRLNGAVKYLNFNLSGSVSSLYVPNESGKTQTNPISRIKVDYKEYGSKMAYKTFDIPVEGTKFSYDDDYINWMVTDYSTATGTGIEFNINQTFEILVTVEDTYGKTSTATIIILPDRPLLSFRDKQLGINIIPRKLSNITERVSEEGENPALDIAGYIYSNGREVPVFSIIDAWGTRPVKDGDLLKPNTKLIVKASEKMVYDYLASVDWLTKAGYTALMFKVDSEGTPKNVLYTIKVSIVTDTQVATYTLNNLDMTPIVSFSMGPEDSDDNLSTDLITAEYTFSSETANPDLPVKWVEAAKEIFGSNIEIDIATLTN